MSGSSAYQATLAERTPTVDIRQPQHVAHHTHAPMSARTGTQPTIFDLQNVRVSVVVPAMNEAANLPHVLPRIPAWVHEVLLVDGFSTDGTVEVARQLWPGIIIVHQEGRGKGAALRSGFAAATGDIIVMLDADGSTDPAEIPVFVGALLSGADFVKGSRFLQGGGTSDMTFFRQFGHWFLLQAVRKLFGGNYSDLCYGYSAFWKHVLPRLALNGNGFEIETMMNVRALRAKLKIAEVPSFEHDRIHGLSNLRALPDGWRILKTIARERLRPWDDNGPGQVIDLVTARRSRSRQAQPEQPPEPLLDRAVGD